MDIDVYKFMYMWARIWECSPEPVEPVPWQGVEHGMSVFGHVKVEPLVQIRVGSLYGSCCLRLLLHRHHAPPCTVAGVPAAKATLLRWSWNTGVTENRGTMALKLSASPAHRRLQKGLS